ncbi:MAG: AbrB/MazE/SpoVT family DNA-binding domain-containing protein [Candidatus Aminicenantes bacterium]|jgi:antitoxin MazE
MNTIKVKIIRIGNSRGIRLSKSLIEQYNMKDEVLLEAKKDAIVIRPVENPRAGWEQSFERMRLRGDDVLLDEGTELEPDWDEEEWKW